MSRPLRLQFPGSLWHITARGNNRQRTFLDDDDRRFFLNLLGECVERFRWILTAYVLMPNHYHLVIQLTETTLSKGMRQLNGSYTQHFNWRHERVGHLFQGRFKGLLVDKEEYSLELLRYVVLNPVRADITHTPDSYEWSSHRAVLGATPAPRWLAVDDVLLHFGPTRDIALPLYRRFVDEGITRRESLWDGIVGQIYLGGEEWIDEVRERIALKPRSEDYPRCQKLPYSMDDVITCVARTFSVPEERIRNGRGGSHRMVAAWLGWNNALLTSREIGSALNIRSSQVARLVSRCESDSEASEAIRRVFLPSVDERVKGRPDPTHTPVPTVTHQK